MRKQYSGTLNGEGTETPTSAGWSRTNYANQRHLLSTVAIQFVEHKDEYTQRLKPRQVRGG
jgi:hypothetical protein